MKLFAAAIALALAGCTTTGQSFVERTYTEPDAAGHQHVVDETIVKNRTWVPPFGSKADSTHDMLAEIGADGEWHLEMGSAGQLDGGEIAAFVQAIAQMTAEITKLIAVLEGAPAPLLEPLTLPGGVRNE